MIAGSPFVDAVQGTRPDLLVEAARRESVAELAVGGPAATRRGAHFAGPHPALHRGPASRASQRGLRRHSPRQPPPADTRRAHLSGHHRRRQRASPGCRAPGDDAQRRHTHCVSPTPFGGRRAQPLRPRHHQAARRGPRAASSTTSSSATGRSYRSRSAGGCSFDPPPRYAAGPPPSPMRAAPSFVS